MLGQEAFQPISVMFLWASAMAEIKLALAVIKLALAVMARIGAEYLALTVICTSPRQPLLDITAY